MYNVKPVLKKLLFVTLITFFSCNVIKATENISIENIRGDTELLREIALKIIARPQAVQSMKEKMFKHGPEMFEAWKKTAKWGGLSEEEKENLKKVLPRTQIEGLLKRKEFVLIDHHISSDPIDIVNEIIHQGTPIFDVSGQSQNIYGIKITYDLSPRVSGELYKRPDNEEELGAPSVLTKIYISFDINDIVKKMTTEGKNKWDIKKDGVITTLTPTERS
jgi:hypothetical protein